MKPKSQTEAILHEMKKGKTLNILSAFKLTGTMKLSTRISDLRKRGYKFKQTIKRFKTRYGTSGMYMDYKLLR